MHSNPYRSLEGIPPYPTFQDPKASRHWRLPSQEMLGLLHDGIPRAHAQQTQNPHTREPKLTPSNSSTPWTLDLPAAEAIIIMVLEPFVPLEVGVVCPPGVALTPRACRALARRPWRLRLHAEALGIKPEGPESLH